MRPQRWRRAGSSTSSQQAGVFAGRIRPGGRVGAVRVGDVQVRVRPKIPMQRFVFLVSYAMGSVTWIQSDILVSPDADLEEVLAEVFAASVSRHDSAWPPSGLPAHGGGPALRTGADPYRRAARAATRPASADRGVRSTSTPWTFRRTGSSEPRSVGFCGSGRIFEEIYDGDYSPYRPASRMSPAWFPARHFRGAADSAQCAVPRLAGLARMILLSSSFENRVGEIRIDTFSSWRCGGCSRPS